jgi:hypothetical protein
LNLKLSLEEEFKKISENFKNKAGVRLRLYETVLQVCTESLLPVHDN